MMTSRWRSIFINVCTLSNYMRAEICCRVGVLPARAKEFRPRSRDPRHLRPARPDGIRSDAAYPAGRDGGPDAADSARGHAAATADGAAADDGVIRS